MQTSGRRAIGVALITQAVGIGTTFGAFSLLVQPLEQSFGAERWQVSLAPALWVVAMAAGGMTIGPILDRGSIRRVMLGGALLHAVGLLVLSQVESLGLAGFVCFLTGLSIPSLGPLAGSTLVGRIFDEDRGRAVGIVNMGGPIGGFSFAALAGWMLGHTDWRDTLVLFAAISAAINIPATLLIPSFVEDASATGDAEADAGVDMASLARSPAFLLLAATFALATGTAAGWASQMAPYLDGLGVSLGRATALVAVASGVAVIGPVLIGVLSDRLSGTKLMLGMLVVGIAAFATYTLGRPFALVATLMLVFGVMTGGMIPVYTSLVSERIGVASLGRAMGLTNLLMLPVSAAAGPLSAAVHDATGSYTPALVGCVGAYVLASWTLVASGRATR